MTVTVRFVRHHLALLIVALLAMGLAWGLWVSLATASSPSPTTGKVVLRIGWTTDPDNLNPFIGYANWTFEIWSLNYQSLFGLGVDGKPTLDVAAQFPTQANGGISPDGKVWTIHIKPDLRWQDGTPLTADRCRLDLQLRGQEPHGERQRADDRHPERQGSRPDHGADRVLRAQGRHGVLGHLHPAQAHLAERESPGGPEDLHQQPAGDRQRPVRDGQVGEGKLPRDGSQPLLLRAKAGHRHRSSSRSTRTPTRWPRTSRAARSMLPTASCPPSSGRCSRPRASRRSASTTTTGTTSTATATRGPRAATQCCATGDFVTRSPMR